MTVIRLLLLAMQLVQTSSVEFRAHIAWNLPAKRVVELI